MFDGAWLWEEYLATILMPIGYKHPRNKKGEGRIYLCNGSLYPRYPDFYCGEGNGIILDAKYKRKIDTRDDINQILTYMYRLKGSRCGFIFPRAFDEDMKDFSPREFLGYGGELTFYKMAIPNQSDLVSYEEFADKMAIEEENVRNYLDPYSH